MAKNQDMLWTVLGQGKKKYHLLCKCSCGEIREVIKYAILNQTSKCCGHSRKDGITRHGKAGTPEHVCWHAIRNRCLKPGHKYYPLYGGRGIKMCPRWKDKKEGFQNFLADMGPKPDDGQKYVIDRIDPEGHYEPGNCRWVTTGESARNKRTNRMFSYRGGPPKCLKDWANEKGCYLSVLLYRIDVKGMSFEEAFDLPLQTNSRTRNKPIDEETAD